VHSTNLYLAKNSGISYHCICLTAGGVHHIVKAATQPTVCNVTQHVGPIVHSHHVLTAHLLECSRLQHIVGAAIKLLHPFIKAWTAVVVDYDGCENLPQCYMIITQRHCDLS